MMHSGIQWKAFLHSRTFESRTLWGGEKVFKSSVYCQRAPRQSRHSGQIDWAIGFRERLLVIYSAHTEHRIRTAKSSRKAFVPYPYKRITIYCCWLAMWIRLTVRCLWHLASSRSGRKCYLSLSTPVFTSRYRRCLPCSWGCQVGCGARRESRCR